VVATATAEGPRTDGWLSPCWREWPPVAVRSSIRSTGRASAPEEVIVAPDAHHRTGVVSVDGRPDALDGPHDLSMVYGGGGVFGIAYGAGVARGLLDAGVPVDTAPALGTSAGSWVAGVVALGLRYEDFEGLGSPPVPTRSPVVHRMARQVFGDARHHLVAASAVHLRSRRRHILDGGRYDLADLAAASSAVPGLLPPHRIDGRLYVDGGMWSVTSIDAARDAEEVIVVAPLAGSVLGAMGRSAGFMLERELRSWRAAHPGKRITLIRPNREIARLAGRNPMALFDADRARAVFPRAVAQGQRWGARLAAPAQAA
jgi:NTE family protein